MQDFFLYILRCFDGSYYVGHTDDIQKRISEHTNGLCGYTRSRCPFEVVFTERFSSREDAINAEHKIKKWSRVKKEALANNDWKSLSRLSQKKFNR